MTSYQTKLIWDTSFYHYKMELRYWLYLLATQRNFFEIPAHHSDMCDDPSWSPGRNASSKHCLLYNTLKMGSSTLKKQMNWTTFEPSPGFHKIIWNHMSVQTQKTKTCKVKVIVKNFRIWEQENRPVNFAISNSIQKVKVQEAMYIPNFWGLDDNVDVVHEGCQNSQCNSMIQEYNDVRQT